MVMGVALFTVGKHVVMGVALFTVGKHVVMGVALFTVGKHVVMGVALFTVRSFWPVSKSKIWLASLQTSTSFHPVKFFNLI